ncbi:hypothetical protein EOPP23_12880 [Endozoicomonas sp. OPT23]|uniref:hypothetical protein n=1 Tax=Endozoicomonas sp. OPT23 TaxID=2072845 RepID=UPI00129A1598|nr:hypothetical protein [Endozoicomonas sp. OPT23]MRI33882.1 hypothetical protein [Endozoicomonas sp. OPT23]
MIRISIKTLQVVIFWLTLTSLAVANCVYCGNTEAGCTCSGGFMDSYTGYDSEFEALGSGIEESMPSIQQQLSSHQHLSSTEPQSEGACGGDSSFLPSMSVTGSRPLISGDMSITPADQSVPNCHPSSHSNALALRITQADLDRWRESLDTLNNLHSMFRDFLSVRRNLASSRTQRLNAARENLRGQFQNEPGFNEASLEEMALSEVDNAQIGETQALEEAITYVLMQLTGDLENHSASSIQQLALPAESSSFFSSNSSVFSSLLQHLISQPVQQSSLWYLTLNNLSVISALLRSSVHGAIQAVGET